MVWQATVDHSIGQSRVRNEGERRVSVEPGALRMSTQGGCTELLAGLSARIRGNMAAGNIGRCSPVAVSPDRQAHFSTGTEMAFGLFHDSDELLLGLRANDGADGQATSRLKTDQQR